MIDISVPIRPGMFVYHDNPGVSLSLAQSLARGDGANVSRLDFGVHTGTHVDAPRHFFDDGTGAEAIPPEALVGDAWVVDATALTGPIDAAALASLDLPPAGAERLIFKTTNSRLWAEPEFTRDFIRFAGSGAEAILARGDVRLVGIDYLSIGDPDAHHVFLGNGIVPLEGVNLTGVEPGPYRLVCTALKIEGSDGAPARAFLVEP
jgi:arylformamidase